MTKEMVTMNQSDSLIDLINSLCERLCANHSLKMSQERFTRIATRCCDTSTHTPVQCRTYMEVCDRIKRVRPHPLHTQHDVARVLHLVARLDAIDTQSGCANTHVSCVLLLLLLVNHKQSQQARTRPHTARDTPPHTATPTVAHSHRQLPSGARKDTSTVQLPTQPSSAQCAAVQPVCEQEFTLLRALLYALRGISSPHIQFSASHTATTQPAVSTCPLTCVTLHDVSLQWGSLLRRLAALGVLYRHAQFYCRMLVSGCGFGLVTRTFGSACQSRLDNYCGVIALLETQVSARRLSLRQAAVWLSEPAARLHYLATLLDTVCRSCDSAQPPVHCATTDCSSVLGTSVRSVIGGGALISVIQRASQHGDSCLAEDVTDILSVCCAPFLEQLELWMFEGRLDDPYGELFVASDETTTSAAALHASTTALFAATNTCDDLQHLWHSRYTLRMAQIPHGMFTVEQARGVLVSGKCVTLLRSVLSAEAFTRLQQSSVVRRLRAAWSASLSTERRLAALVTAVHGCMCEQTLHVFWEQLDLMAHFVAARHFLLLARGDFVSYLMQLLAADLARPASELYIHTLSAQLETAIHSTSAQYEAADTLARVHVHTLNISPGDLGWDTFSLAYHVDGALCTVFATHTLTDYLMLFNALWRSKRMEFTLCNVWRRQMVVARGLQQTTAGMDTAGEAGWRREACELLHSAHILSAQMVHFVQQFAYYVTFEVMECLWTGFCVQLRRATSLDEIIQAHAQFLCELKRRALLDEHSLNILHQLRVIYDLVLQYDQLHAEIVDAVETQLRMARADHARCMQAAARGQFSTDAATVAECEERGRQFARVFVPDARAQLENILHSYRNMVSGFLLMLASQTDNINLQYLSFRLDFNVFYQNRDNRLGIPFTYQHRRSSIIR